MEIALNNFPNYLVNPNVVHPNQAACGGDVNEKFYLQFFANAIKEAYCHIEYVERIPSIFEHGKLNEDFTEVLSNSNVSLRILAKQSELQIVRNLADEVSFIIKDCTKENTKESTKEECGPKFPEGGRTQECGRPSLARSGCARTTMATSVTVGHDIVDTRVAKAPKEYDGSKLKWRHFKAQMLSYLGAVSQELKHMMKVVEELRRPINHKELDMSERQIALDSKLHVIMGSVLVDKGLDVFCNVEDGHGLEIWRRFSRRHLPRTAGHNRGRLLHLVHPSKEIMDGDFYHRRDKWEEAEKEYKRLAKKDVPEDIRMGVLAQILAPDEIKEHLSMNTHRLESYDSIMDEIEDYLQNRESRGDAMQLMS